MAQGGNRRKKAPVYSADTLALRIFCGFALVALGVVIFLAVVLRLEGPVFSTLRDFSYGLMGGLAVLLPVWPAWAGALLIWSAQRRAPVQPLLYGSLAFCAFSAFLVLVTRYGNETLLRHLTGMSDGSWGDVIHRGFRFSAERRAGGALGILLAWPLWRVTGEVLSAGITLLLTVFCVLMAFRLTPSRLRDLVTGKASLWQRKPREDRGEAEQIAWQQEQERRRQIAWQQQQELLMRQQQQQQQQMPLQQAPMQAQGGYTYTQGQPYTGDGTGMAEWQEQLGVRQDPQHPHKSNIFHRGGGEQGAGGSRPGPISRIFGKKTEPDGLSDASAEEKERAARMARELTRQERERHGRPEEKDRLAGDPRTARPAEEDPRTARPAEEDPRTARPAAGDPRAARPAAGDARTAQPAEESFRRPVQEEENPGVSRRDGGRQEMPGSREAQQPGRAETGESPRSSRESRSGRDRSGSGAEHGRSGSAWAQQVEEARRRADEMAAEQEADADTGRRARREQPAARVPEQVQSIGEKTWQPELKHVEEKEEEEERYWTPTPYYAPPITDLQMPKADTENTTEEDGLRSRRLEETLASFNVAARVVHVTHGPAISRFELELASGTKVSKVAGLEKDIAYGMEATSVRIEAPIPGKSLVGVEVPNRKVSTVTLREVLESPQMQNAKSILTVALGKDIAGTPVVCDLARMPHMLIAGATGSGKSVCINAIINSLLYRAGPDEVKLILVDPKVVELQVYNDIPHLLIPVVNDPHKASAALAWAVAEMMDRYDRFAQRRVRNLEGYNGVLEEGEKPMPRIVIIIDELADLMMVCKKDVEEYICRLTQLARAAGIHLIVATQRPSVDVITGLIKANIPSRIAFKTASYVDSRTILDRNGSEQLLGWGDMLYLPTGSFSPTRVQGCFLSDDEVNRIAADVKRANPGTYDPDILEKLDELSRSGDEAPGMDMIGGPAESSGADGGLFEQAVEFAIADGQISTSTLQRRLKVGYARAGRLTDEMEERGIVSAKDGSKPRKCLITREQWEEMKKSTEGMT